MKDIERVKYHSHERKGVQQTENQIGFIRQQKTTEHANELTDLMKVIGHVPKLMAMWLFKFLKRPTNSGKVKITGKRVNRGGGYGLELPTLRAVVSPLYAMFRKGFCLFRSVASGRETTAGRTVATLRVQFLKRGHEIDEGRICSMCIYVHEFPVCHTNVLSVRSRIANLITFCLLSFHKDVTVPSVKCFSNN